MTADRNSTSRRGFIKQAATIGAGSGVLVATTSSVASAAGDVYVTGGASNSEYLINIGGTYESGTLDLGDQDSYSADGPVSFLRVRNGHIDVRSNVTDTVEGKLKFVGDATYEMTVEGSISKESHCEFWGDDVDSTGDTTTADGAVSGGKDVYTVDGEIQDIQGIGDYVDVHIGY